MSFQELKQHGTADFPIQLYSIDEHHPKYEMAFHWHPETELIRVREGELHITLNNRTTAAHTGDILYVNSEVVHGATPIRCVYECVVFQQSFLSMPNSLFYDSLLAGDIYVKELFRCDDPESAPVREITAQLIDALSGEGDSARFRVVGALYNLYGWIAGTHAYTEGTATQFLSARDEKNVQKLKRVLALIRGSYDRTITIAEMADTAGVSQQYFCTFFRSMTAKSPTDYVNNYRIERACRKLMNSDASVTEVAFSCGFNDLSYFIKIFKHEKGVTPTQFRRSTENH